MQSGILQLTKIEYSSNHEVALLTFKLTHGELDFEEGQFLLLETIDYEFDGKTLRKPYSIASTHNHFLETQEVQFYVKKASENGMSHYLTQVIKIGDMIRFQWPNGSLTDEKLYNKYLFISIGSGIAAVYPHYLEAMSEEFWADKVVNIFWEKTVQDLIPTVMKNLERNDKEVKNILFLSREENLQEPFQRGHVQDALHEAIDFLEDKKFVAFLCGKPAMVLDVKKKLLQAGLPEWQIKAEMY